MADLKSFGFTMDETTPNTATFGLADLASFSASVGPGLTISSLALATGWVQGSNQTTYRRDFSVASLNDSDASTSFELVGLSFPLTSGTVTITSVTTTVPEPSTFALAVAGALTVAGGRSRRPKA